MSYARMTMAQQAARYTRGPKHNPAPDHITHVKTDCTSVLPYVRFFAAKALDDATEQHQKPNEDGQNDAPDPELAPTVGELFKNAD